MNLKLKQLCALLCGISILNTGYAVTNPMTASPTPTTSASNASSSSGNNQSTTSDDKVVLNFEKCRYSKRD